LTRHNPPERGAPHTKTLRVPEARIKIP
jgi:hypothetical protein